MWPNADRNQSTRRAANIKGYLGRGSGPNDSSWESVSMSSVEADLGAASSLSSTSSSSAASSSSPAKITQFLVEIPEDLVLENVPHRTSLNMSRKEPSDYASDEGNETRPSNDDNDSSISETNIDKSRPRWEGKHEKTAKKGPDVASAILEIKSNLSRDGDMEDYMLSVYMNDESSIYTKATADSTFSSSSSCSSISSTRRRHRGACRNRRHGSGQKLSSSSSFQQASSSRKSSNWVDSMKESSTNVFVNGEVEWTPSSGWRTMQNKMWESKPEECWTDTDPLFDAVQGER